MTFTSTRQPDPEDRVPRGRNQRNILLDAIKAETGDNPVEFMRKVLRIGLGLDGQPPVPMLLSEAIKRIQPPFKPVMEKISLDITDCNKDSEKAVKILAATALGQIAPDVGQLMIAMLKDTIAIAETTELIKRLEALEEAIAKANKQ